MSESKPNCETLIPHLVCNGAAAAIDFYKKAFGAVEHYRLGAGVDERLMHACLSIGGQTLFLADDFPEYCGGKASSPLALGGSSVTIHRYVPDCDAAIKKAADAGATVKMPAADMFWGDRYGVIVDPFGHTWSFATHIKDLTPEEIAAAGKAAMAQHSN
ncbi:VOC family protein [Planctomicrobium piriforme]|uniref:Uncharacterized conserved protein PhnB, glyoxalase superfamily n=1 Tax=Planctomicrobium piriforme TaxID=1576369 RepID=A0A1I3EZG5_9PLAN|nr:VOC family protein [Planctomicrobium piriforme]SFI04394.1 Uncharacterized conserved protein PhnB, glyoxalase superfamily [Planctomicrobium piriforme]